MKQFLALLMSALLLPTGSWAQNDDMYFVPSKKTKRVIVQELTPTEDARIYYYDSEDILDEDFLPAPDDDRDVDAYNRRYVYDYEEDTDKEEEERGRWVNDFDGTEQDFEYSKRLLLFSAPTVGIPVSSALYWDLCYGPSAIYWNVYDDGFYAYAFPSTWNRLYYDPFYFSYSWGWRPSSFYYSSYYYWGWNRPWHRGWYDPWRPGYHRPPYWAGIHKPGGGHHHIGNVRPVNRPSVYRRETSSKAIGGRETGRQRTTVTTPTRSSQRSSATPARSSSSTRNSATQRTTTPTRSSSTTNQRTTTPTRSSSTTTQRTTTPTRSSSTTTQRRATTPTRSSSTVSRSTSVPTRSSSTTTFSSPSRSSGSSFSSPSRSSGGGSGRSGRR